MVARLATLQALAIFDKNFGSIAKDKRQNLKIAARSSFALFAKGLNASEDPPKTPKSSSKFIASAIKIQSLSLGRPVNPFGRAAFPISRVLN